MTHLPNFFIIGAMKCATSSLHEQLALQPGIFMSAMKEPNFFSDDDQYSKGLSWYTSHFAEGRQLKLRGESSTHYTKLPTYPLTIHRIKEVISNAKFIYVMRHPIDRLISQYIHEWSQRVISVEINQAVEQHQELISYSEYSRQLAPYLEAFGPNKVLPVFFERMISEPQAELERVCRFLDYDRVPQWSFDLDAQNVSVARMRKSWWRDMIVDAPGLKEIRRRFVPKRLRLWVRSLWTLKRKPVLSDANLERLKTTFDRDLSQLGAWLGMELSCDTFKNIVRKEVPEWTSRIVN